MNYKKVLVAFFSMLYMLFFMNKALLLPAAGGLPAGQAKRDKPILEYEAKAAIISSIVRYCKWPANSSLSKPEGHFIIGAFEEDDIVSYLIEKAKSRKMKSKKIKIVIIEKDDAIKECHLLFINEVSKKRLKKILEIVNDLPILTAADTGGFAKRGVMISMFRTSKKLAFNVNQTSLLKSGLILRSGALSLANEIF